MSNRTAAATKAVNDAWKKERELVQIGKGTRDWTQEQQEEILERGRAYYHSDDPNDKDDGKAFEGHHMKSVEAYPEFQGDSDNIQFLSRPEHIEAHRGAYKNASNWYFDPVTHEFTDFGEGKYIPCAVIDLSYPVNRIDYNDEKTKDNRPEKANQKESASYSKESKQTSSHKFSDTKPKPTEEKTGFLSRAKGLLKKAVAGGKKAVQWGAEHKELIGAAIAVGISTVAVAKTKTVNNSSASDSTDSQNDNTYPSDDFGGSYSAGTDDDSFDVEEFDNSPNGSPKSPHSRRGYPGHRWKKNKDGELELTETWISPAKIHPDQMNDDEYEDE